MNPTQTEADALIRLMGKDDRFTFHSFAEALGVTPQMAKKYVRNAASRGLIVSQGDQEWVRI